LVRSRRSHRAAAQIRDALYARGIGERARVSPTSCSGAPAGPAGCRRGEKDRPACTAAASGSASCWCSARTFQEARQLARICGHPEQLAALDRASRVSSSSWAFWSRSRVAAGARGRAQLERIDAAWSGRRGAAGPESIARGRIRWSRRGASTGGAGVRDERGRTRRRSRRSRRRTRSCASLGGPGGARAARGAWDASRRRSARGGNPVPLMATRLMRERMQGRTSGLHRAIDGRLRIAGSSALLDLGASAALQAVDLARAVGRRARGGAARKVASRRPCPDCRGCGTDYLSQCS